MFFNKFHLVKTVFRVHILILLAIFTGFKLIMSFKYGYIFYNPSGIPPDIIYFGALTFGIAGYLYINSLLIYKEFIEVNFKYSEWIKKQKTIIVFLISIVLNFSITLIQLGFIKILIHFTSLSLPVCSNISLLPVFILNYFLMSQLLFVNRLKRYKYEVTMYTIITICGLVINFLAVKWLYINVINWPLLSFLYIFFDKETIPQLLASALFGWVWFLAHKKITFMNNTRVSN